MPVILLETKIHAPIDNCFNLSTSIDLHQLSTAGTNERAIAGVTSGLIGLHDTVTWEAVHFGIKQQLTSVITKYNRPLHFRDEQQKGAFKSFKHDHYFESKDGFVMMTDRFDFESPYGIFGKSFNVLVLKKYLEKFLKERNQVIKAYAESDKWKTILK